MNSSSDIELLLHRVETTRGAAANPVISAGLFVHLVAVFLCATKDDFALASPSGRGGTFKIRV
jgi:hypothetical protein